MDDENQILKITCKIQYIHGCNMKYIDLEKKVTECVIHPVEPVFQGYDKMDGLFMAAWNNEFLNIKTCDQEMHSDFGADSITILLNQ